MFAIGVNMETFALIMILIALSALLTMGTQLVVTQPQDVDIATPLDLAC